MRHGGVRDVDQAVGVDAELLQIAGGALPIAADAARPPHEETAQGVPDAAVAPLVVFTGMLQRVVTKMTKGR